MEANNSRKFWIILLMILGGPLSFLVLFSPELRKQPYVRVILGGWIFVWLASLSPIASIIGINSFLFLDNLLMQSQSVSPVVPWSILGVFIGLIYGAVVAWKKYTLDFKLTLLPVALLLFFLVLLFFLNDPLKAGTWSGSLNTTSDLIPPTTPASPGVTSSSNKTSHSKSNQSENITSIQHKSTATISATKTYTGSIGKLNTIYHINWMSDGSIEGSYYYTSRSNAVYTLKGKESSDKILLTEYTNGNITAYCTLYNEDQCFSGKMNNTDGRSFEMKMCEHLEYKPESTRDVIEPTVIETSVREEPKVFTFVEQNPEFPGGDGELVKYLQKNIQYPQMERDNDIQGKVLVRFIIMEDGAVSNVTVVRGVSPGLDKEAIRVVQSLPKFVPGYQQGKPVRVYFNLPVVFRLS